MDPGKPTKTLADYMVIAISPALIMVMVHSVCFFLVEVFYRGETTGGVKWVLFWFVLAVVLIARIGIEQGTGYAMGYGLLLAFATWVYLATVHLNVIFGAVLLAAVWFTAHKLTCNCTLIDDDEDASGQGLLQAGGRLRSLFKKRRPAPAEERAGEGTAAQKPMPSQILRPLPAGVPTKKKVHSEIPGIWLVYYSLAALPVFGLGQTLLPAGDMAARHQGFVYLFCYLAGALGLLVTTSFLGLRRYLRQRYLDMPGNIALGWVQFGAVAAAIVLLLTLLLPRPGAGEAWGALRYHVDTQLRRASEYAARFNSHGSGSGRAGNQTSPNDQPGKTEAQPGQSPDQDQTQEAKAKGDGEQSGKASDQGPPAGDNGSGQSGRPLPNMSAAASSIYPWLKTLFWLVVLFGAGWLLFRYRMALLTVARSAWAAVRNFIATLLGLFGSSAAPAPAMSKKLAVPPFRTFKNPFLTGGAQVWSPEKLIAYSYDALLSWAMEKDAAQGSPQTPRELCRQLGEEIPEAANALEHLAFLYGHVAYGASLPGSYQPEHLRLLWDYMSTPRPGRSNVEVPDNELAGKA